MSRPGIALPAGAGACAAVLASAAPSLAAEAPAAPDVVALGPGVGGGPLWTVVGMGAVILAAYIITRLVTKPLLRRADDEARESQGDAVQAPGPQPSTVTGASVPPVSTAAAAPNRVTPGAVDGAGPASAAATLILQAGVIEVDPLRREVVVDGERLDLTDTEYRLLVHLVDHSGQVLTRADLLRDVWGHKEAVYSRTVDTHIQRLRDKLGAARDQLETIRGAGYRLREA